MKIIKITHLFISSSLLTAFMIASIGLLTSCTDPHEVWTFSDRIMGTYYVVKVERGETELEEQQLAREIHGLLTDLNLTFSTYDPKSELSLVNQLDSNKNLMISSDLIQVLDLSRNIHLKTAGAFDVTIGPLVNAWGFGPDGIRRKPRQHEIAELKELMGMDKFSITKDGVLKKTNGKLYIDLSAVAKGYAVDRVIQYLKQNGFKSSMVEIGGEVRTIGKKEGKTPWLIGIEGPTEIRGKSIHKVVPLIDKAMATSGSYRNYRKFGEQVFTHTLNPVSGMPTNHPLISVSVISNDCATADALATALMVMGPEKGPDFVEKEGILSYFLIKDTKGFKVIASSAFKEYMKQVKDAK